MITTAVFDLETSDLAGDRGIVLCGVVQSSKRRRPLVVRSDETNPDWKRGRRENDRETVRLIAEELEAHDVLIAHNGTRFDLPFLRTRMLRWGMKPLRDMKVLDPCSVSWRKFRLRNNALQTLRNHLRVGANKTPLDMALWMRAILDGDREAMDAIVEHCVADVKVLSSVADLVKPYVRVLDDRGSAL